MPHVLNKKILTFVLIAIFALAVFAFYATKPNATREFARPETHILVDIMKLKTQSFTPTIKSYGRVEPLIQSQLIAQVGGRVIEVSDAFRDGGFFIRSDVLMRIDPADYEIEVAIAQSTLADAKQLLQEQIALADQAKLDWDRAGGKGKALPLTLREPQLVAAKAKVTSAEAGVKKAMLNLERTSITAPFDGRVLSKSVDLGQVVAQGSQLGEIYATNAIEVRLPIKNGDLQFMSLPESYRTEAPPNQPLPDVTLVSELVKTEQWPGKIVRTSSAIDENSRQLYVVAQITDPFGEQAKNRFPLKIGQYITANITGNTINEALIIPVSTIYQGSYVYVYRDGAVFRQPIRVAWQDNTSALVEEGLKAGDQIVLSPLGQINSGTKVSINGEGKRSKKVKPSEQPMGSNRETPR